MRCMVRADTLENNARRVEGSFHEPKASGVSAITHAPRLVTCSAREISRRETLHARRVDCSFAPFSRTLFGKVETQDVSNARRVPNVCRD
jgi:hypothetical protein